MVADFDLVVLALELGEEVQGDPLRVLEVADDALEDTRLAPETRDMYYPVMALLIERAPPEHQAKMRQIQQTLLTETEALAKRVEEMSRLAAGI